MGMYWTTSKRFTFVPGAALPSPLRFELGPSILQDVPDGPPEKVGSGVTAVAGVLRIAIREWQNLQVTQSLYQLTLQPPDEGTLITPIDIPCVVPVQLPITGIITPTRAPSLLAGGDVTENLVITAWVDSGDTGHAYGSTLWANVPAGGNVVVPDWAGAVSLLDATGAIVANWLDALGAVVGTVVGTYQPRPKRAVRLGNPAAQDELPVLFHQSSA